MPPKKKEEVKERPLLGRFKTNLKVGIVGLPNVGKSTLFNTLSKLSVPAENFPFCTIEPNNARIFIPDERFTWLCNSYKPKNQTPAFLEVVDIAGLVRGASTGEGLGNNFLSHISAVDGIFHCVRAFEEADVVHVEDRVDPVADLEIIHNELRLKDISAVERTLADLNKQKNRGLTKDQIMELDLVERLMAVLKGGTDVRFGDWSSKDIEWLNEYQLLTSKPVTYLVNLSEKDYARKKNKFLKPLAEWVAAHGGEPIVPFSGVMESKIVNMPADDVPQYCLELGATSALNKIITTGFRMVQLIYFFTAGHGEVKCWQIRRQSKAPQAAGAIHSDFERGFICAEVMKFEELKELGDEQAVKAAGKYRQEGKAYVVEDGDVIFFKFNVTAEKKK